MEDKDSAAFKANQTPSSSKQNIDEVKILAIFLFADSVADFVKSELVM
jgi:hypothetical protein